MIFGNIITIVSVCRLSRIFSVFVPCGNKGLTVTIGFKGELLVCGQFVARAISSFKLAIQSQ